MGREDERQNGLTGLAKRWLKTQLRFHGDPIKAVGDRREAEALEQQLHDRAEEDLGRAVAGALLPSRWKRKLDELEQQTEARQAEVERRRRAEHEARPRAAVQVAFSGGISGRLEQPLPVSVSQPKAPGEALALALEPLDPVAVGGHAFLGLQVAVSAYVGPGTYDLSAIAQRDGTDAWDATACQLWLDTTDEPFYWVPDYGPAAITVEPDERTVRIRTTMENASGARVEVDATVVLPEAATAAGAGDGRSR